MSASLAWYELRWPRSVELGQLQDLSLVLASTGGAPLVLETLGEHGTVGHRLGLPASRAAALIEQLRGALPGLDLRPLESRPTFAGGRALELRLTSRQRSLRIEQSALVSSAVLTALTLARSDEAVLVQWQLIGALPAIPVGSGSETAPDRPMSVADVLFGRRGHLDAEGRQALRIKRGLPVWRVVGRIAVRAATPAREQQLLRETVAALRLAEAPGVRLLGRRCNPGRLDRPGRSWLAPLRLNTLEVVTLAAWPLGQTVSQPVETSTTRLLPPSKAVARRGRVIALSTAPGEQRPLALSPEDSLRHLHVLGPTGTGKSTLLLNLITQDIQAGRSVVVLEPKGDLIRDILERIPKDRQGDVVILDPSDEACPVGLNPLALDGRPPELVADQLLGMFRSLYESSWGPRTNDILGAALLTLARSSGMSLVALPALLVDAGFRHRLVSRLDDPIGLGSFWMAFENWSDAERTAAIAPSMSRIRPFLLRPQLRAALGQARPRFQLSKVFTGRKILLVNLAKGVVGAEAASLLGSLILAQLWAAALRRVTVEPEQRPPAFVYVDEVQDYLHLPTDLGEALVQARGLGVGFVLAHQHLSQLDPPTRSTILSSARSRICFQLGADDARALATPPLIADDLRELPAFELYAQLMAQSAVQPWCSGRSLPPPPVTSNEAEVRARSRERYGLDRRLVEEQIEHLLGGRHAGDDLAPRRRSNGGSR